MKNDILKKISGCFVLNDEKSPSISGSYNVIYTDGKEGFEFYNGNLWIVKYKHPVKMWFLILNTKY